MRTRSLVVGYFHPIFLTNSDTPHPSTGGRPKARRMTTDMTADQQALYDLFNLHRWAPTPT